MPLYLVAVMGLPGSGKSVAARMIATTIDAELLRSDVVRKEIYPIPRYTPKEGHHVYQTLFERSALLLAQGRSVVLDATFREDAPRQQARRLAETHGACWRLLLVTAPEPVVRDRLLARHNDASDADYAVYQQLRTEFSTIEQAHDVLDNSGTLDELKELIVNTLKRSD